MFSILMFASGFAPYHASENIVNSKLALAMIKRGWNVKIISAKDEEVMYGTQWITPWLELKEHTHEVSYGMGNSLKRNWQRIADSLKMGYPIGGVRWARQALNIAIQLHKINSFDFVLSRSVSDFTHLPSIKFSNLAKVPMIANWNDPPGQIFPWPYNYQYNKLSVIIQKKYFQKAAQIAYFNTFPCERLYRFMKQFLSIPNEEKVAIIPHISLAGFQQSHSDQKKRFTICHAGNLSLERNPNNLLLALKKINSELPQEKQIELKLLGIENVALMNRIKELDLQKVVHFMGSKNFMETMKILSESTVLAIIEAPCKEGIFSPSKFTDYIQAKRPVLAISPIPGTINDLMTVHGGGKVVGSFEMEDIYLCIKEMYKEWENGELDALLSPSLEKYVDVNTVLDLYEKLFFNIKSNAKLN